MSSMFIPSSSILIILLSPVVFFVLWHLSTTTSSQFSANHLRGKRICLLIAHPDDEAMFFSPTVIALTDPSLGNHLKILCLSTGNADGLGPTRKNELLASAIHLGLRKPDDIFIIDDPSRFPDSMTRTWSASDIASLLSSAFDPTLNTSTSQPQSKSKSKAASTKSKPANTTTTAAAAVANNATGPPTATIDTLITFDPHGISGHPNHASLYHGATAFLASLMHARPGWRCPVELYTLTSISLPRKYIFVLDAPLTMIAGVLERVLPAWKWKRKSGRRKGEEGQGWKRMNAEYEGGRLLFVSGLRDYWRGRGAMVEMHRSQMRWFRWGWIAVGRYMVVNDLRREGG